MVGVLLHRPSDDRYLVLQRSAEKDYGSGVWECITGRVDQGESFTEAAHREAYEELGVEIAIDFIVGTTHFYRGAAKPENEMVGVFFCGTMAEGAELRRSWEHSAHRWLTLTEAEAMFPADYWLVRLIRRADDLHNLMPAALVAYYQAEGFEVA
jgi:8-oxo-dGTP pyrophosphatase MutT (NUDIX family)